MASHSSGVIVDWHPDTVDTGIGDHTVETTKIALNGRYGAVHIWFGGNVSVHRYDLGTCCRSVRARFSSGS